jgi:hypothetical protein
LLFTSIDVSINTAHSRAEGIAGCGKYRNLQATTEIAPADNSSPPIQ